MAVAWIGNRETQFERAVDHAAALLDASRCPVITFDTDVHGTRAAIALAERIGAAYDIIDGGATAREAALITDSGAMTVAPGEARRRADVLVLVGQAPKAHAAWIADIAGSSPDLSAGKPRKLFAIGSGSGTPFGGNGTAVSVGKLDLAAILAALRAHLAGRQITIRSNNFTALADALASAVFPVFLYSGEGMDSLALQMLQGLVSDLNKRKRASTLHLPASDNGWGSVLASTWMTGFPPRTSFARGYPAFDPWRFDVARMIADGEADLHLRVGDPGRPRKATGGVGLIALETTTKPRAGAVVTLAIGAPAADHEAVHFSAQLGTIVAAKASAATGRQSSANVLNAIRERLGQRAAAS